MTASICLSPSQESRRAPRVPRLQRFSPYRQVRSRRGRHGSGKRGTAYRHRFSRNLTSSPVLPTHLIGLAVYTISFSSCQEKGRRTHRTKNVPSRKSHPGPSRPCPIPATEPFRLRCSLNNQVFRHPVFPAAGSWDLRRSLRADPFGKRTRRDPHRCGSPAACGAAFPAVRRPGNCSGTGFCLSSPRFGPNGYLRRILFLCILFTVPGKGPGRRCRRRGRFSRRRRQDPRFPGSEKRSL